MKKLFKNVIRTLSIIAIVLTTALIGVACSTKTAQNRIEANNATMSEENGFEQTIPVADEDEITETSIELNGIYRYSRQISFGDIWYEDEKEVIKFFHTRDLNGVYDAVSKLGFNEYYNYIDTEDEDYPEESMLYFKDNLVYPAKYCVGYFKIYETANTIDEYCYKIEYIEETNTYLIYRQFNYKDETTGNMVETPIYVKVPIESINGSTNIEDGNEYIYKFNTAIVNVSDNNILESKEYIEKLASVFGLEVKEDLSEMMNEVTSFLSSYTFRFTEDFSRLSLINSDNEFIFSQNSNNEFLCLGISFKYDGIEHNITTNEKLVKFIVTIDENTNLTFSLIKK